MKKSLGPKTIAFPLPAFLVGTYDADGKANIMTAAWGGIVASEPPLIAVSIRPNRHTHAAIAENQAFTVAFPRAALAQSVDYAGIFSGKKLDKFAATGLTPVASQKVKAPYPAECPVVAECRLHKRVELGSHDLFVGEILDILADEEALAADGSLDIALVDPIVYAPGADYHRIGQSLGKAFSIGKKLASS
jgi:flavin reductase (DIM6/NTAB) family NADH-FMN oxidoreductase RutF